MTELIKITTNEQGSQVVSARELYEYLEVKTEFTKWCSRMFEYGFEEGRDFSSFLAESSGGRPSIDYVLTTDTAKHFAMIQRTEKGKQARQYFIECERKANDMSTLVGMYSRIIYEKQDEIDELKHRLGEGPKPESRVLIISGRNNLGRDTTTPDLIKEHFTVPKPGDEDVLFLSATEIVRYLKSVVDYRFNTRGVGIQMRLLRFKQEIKLVNGTNKRGYYVINPNYKEQ